MGADRHIIAANICISKKGRASTLDRPIQPLEVASHLMVTLDDLDNAGNDGLNIEQQAANLLGQEDLQLPKLGIVFLLKLGIVFQLKLFREV